MKNFTLYLTMTSIALLGFTSCSDANDDLDALNAASENEITLKKSEDPSIASIASSAGFTELIDALVYVDANVTPSPNLVELFSNGKDQFTVFAPTNDAFDRLFIELDAKGVTVTPQLVLNVLLYHVVEGRRGSNSVVPKNGEREMTTELNGATFKVKPGGMIEAIGNNAQINITTSGATFDISASNGIIHVIDEVILPINLQ